MLSEPMLKGSKDCIDLWILHSLRFQVILNSEKSIRAFSILSSKSFEGCPKHDLDFYSAYYVTSHMSHELYVPCGAGGYRETLPYLVGSSSDNNGTAIQLCLKSVCVVMVWSSFNLVWFHFL
ncbi:unnamed protein product [Ambrosiozyma monospora]|uniref:Unnamed protein product n=1 Tax=Ambrosiozyma monospora TaxID=43982 RepID=A0ACB5T4N5_AMBMO|nr:unnamed protein product [Ambrosiozyma monospora]